MANPAELAKKARTTLASALQALQMDGVPDGLMEMAEPIADTMGILHRIERSGTAEAAECQKALQNVRTALDSLQVAEQHPAVDQAMEAVAGSLSKLFALNKAVEPSRPPPAPKQAAPVVNIPPPTPAVQDLSDLRATIPLENKIQPIRKSPFDPPPQHAPVPQQAAPFAPQQAAPFAPQQAAPFAPQQAAPQQAAPQQAAPQQAAPAANPSQVERVPGMTDAPVPPSTANCVDVELGAHSGSNFYKGLSGNDVVDNGGIFVATYVIPKLGDALALRVHLPGDLEFVSDALVTWVRETRSGESEPGFGAKFTRISDEGRQLVYRYVKNREPIFYDDL